MDMKMLVCSNLFVFILLTFGQANSQDPPKPENPVKTEDKKNASDEFPQETRGWLRICDKADTYLGAETSESCGAGFWFDPPLSVGCVCGHGIWILSTGWCDVNYITLIMRNGECYYVGEGDIKYIRNVGSSENAYGEYHFVYSPGMEYIQGLIDGGNDPSFSYYHPSYTLLLGAVRPSRSVIVGKDGRTCLDAKQRGSLAKFVYDSKLKENVRRQGYTLAKSCYVGRDQLLDSDIHIFDYGFAAKARAIDSVDWTKNTTTYFRDEKKCAVCRPSNSTNGTMLYRPSWDPEGWSNSKKRNRTASGVTNGTATFPNEDYPESAENQIAEYFQEVNCKNWTFAKGTQNDTLREISEQTKRMISAHIAYSLRKIQTPQVNISDYKLFQKSRKILLKVCPQTEVPMELLNGLIRMFRVALRESLLVYPHQQMGNENDTTRITEALDQCFLDARAMDFVYQNGTCPKQFLAVNYTYKITTEEISRNLTSGMPCVLETNGSSFDLPLEAAWKTIMFTHYYCARHFKNLSIEHSQFEQMMESFFNRWMQHRWRNPGPSFEAYKFIFQMYDLAKFTKGLDRCVAASRAYSPYRKWLKRPTYLQFCGQNIFDKNGLVQNAEVLMLGSSNQNTEKSRFNNKAYCAGIWHEPQSLFKLKPQSSKATSKSGECIKYLPEEWKDSVEPNAPWTQGIGSRKSFRQEVFEAILG